MKHLFLSISFFFTVSAHAQKTDLRHEISNLAKAVDGQVGIAVMNLTTKDTLLYNVHGIFPMQSVYKFPLALAVLDQVDRKKLSLNQKIKLTERDLLPDTWSPLRDKYKPGDAITLEEVLMYTVTHSDNNGCDMLFRLLKGPKNVDRYVKKLGVSEIAIAATEEEMHADWDTQFTNWCKPRAMLRLLELFYDGKLLSDSSQKLLWRMMAETSTGPNRIKGLLPKGTEVLHRTGLGNTNAQGITGAVNDVGIVRLPDGRYFAIVVYIGRVKGQIPDIEEKIAEIAKVVYESGWLNAQ